MGVQCQHLCRVRVRVSYSGVGLGLGLGVRSVSGGRCTGFPFRWLQHTCRMGDMPGMAFTCRRRQGELGCDAQGG